MKSIDQRAVSVLELCKIFSVKESWVRQMVFQRRIPYFKLGNLVRFNLCEINDWITKNRGGL